MPIARDITANTITMIPRFRSLELTSFPSLYFIPDLVNSETLTLTKGVVRFPMRCVERKEYFGSGRADNITSFPYDYHLERLKDGTNLYLYFIPSEAYTIKIWGKFSLQEIANEDVDLELTLDKFYIEYLRYGLADYIAEDHTISLPPRSEQRLRELEDILANISPPDLSIEKLANGFGSEIVILFLPQLVKLTSNTTSTSKILISCMIFLLSYCNDSAVLPADRFPPT